MNKVTIVKADDWEGLFVGDVLVHEHHNVTLNDIKECAGETTVNNIEEVYSKQPLEDYLYDMGGFPVTLEETLRINNL